jgi:hypothetical protein
MVRKREIVSPNRIFENASVVKQNFKADPNGRTGNLRYSEAFVASASLNLRLAIFVTLLLVFGIWRRANMLF